MMTMMTMMMRKRRRRSFNTVSTYNTRHYNCPRDGSVDGAGIPLRVFSDEITHLIEF